MTCRASISRLTRAAAGDRRKGLLAYCALAVGPYRIDGLCVRRTTRGKYVVSYPTRVDRDGHEHPYFLPESQEVRDALEERILRAFWSEVGDG